MHILAQSPTPISFMKVITWQIAWLNKESGDQVILLPGFESPTILWLCLCVFYYYAFEIRLCLFCSIKESLAMSSF